MYYEAGVTSIQDGDIRWTGKFTEADCEELATDQFEREGFYRNLVVREVGE